jgi:hypothetical protein
MKGGRNRPWLLTVNTEEGEALFVTKFFAQRDIEQQNALSREIFTNVLASELGLAVPSMALITIDDVFRSTLNDQLHQLKSKHTKYAFGTEYIPGKKTYSPALLAKQLANYDIESIFAFDVLTLNTDRRIKKPNILLDDKQYYLIDHEHTFSLSAIDLNAKNRVGLYRLNKHIFYQALNKKSKYGNEPEFNTFRELFHHLNIDVLDPYITFLNNEGYKTDDCFIIKRYLRELKSEISYFMDIVKGGIQ